VKISRRTVLRSAGLSGIAIALPFLEAFPRPRARAGGPAAERMVLYHWPDGAQMHDWWWQDGVESVQRSELADVMPHLKVVSGLSALEGQTVEGGFGTPHALPARTVATGRPAIPGEPCDGPSIDFVAGEFLAREYSTVISSIYSAPFRRAGSGGPGLAFLADGSGNPPVSQPSVLFQQLFASELDEEAARYLALRRQSILDYVRDDARRLNARLGAEDRIRLDGHLESIRALERAVVRPTCDAPGAPPEVEPVNAPEDAIMPRANALVDLQLLALKCGLTRSIYFSMGHSQCTHYPFELETEIGAPCGASEAHQISHGHGNSPGMDGRAWYQAMVKWRLRPFGTIMRYLASTEGPDGAPLLDKTAVVAFSELSFGGVHDPYDLPVMVGGAGIRGGDHVHYPCDVALSREPLGAPYDSMWTYFGRSDNCMDGAQTPMTNLWLTLLRTLGSTAESFGTTSTGTLSGLWI
jgi:hypothetical protein